VTPPARAPLPWWLAVLVGAAAGVVYDAAFPSQNLWPFAFAGLALMLIALIGRSIAAAALVGFVSGLTFYLTQVSWTSLYLGPLPWLALSIFEALLFAAGAVAITLVYRWIPRAFPSAVGRLGLLPVATAGIWTAREWVTDNWPYGGFSWGRAALSQSESPFAHLVAWLGIAGLSFVMVWLVALAIECARFRRSRTAAALRMPEPIIVVARTPAKTRRVLRHPFTRVAIAVGAFALVLAVPSWPATTSGGVRVGAVQGNGPAGYFQPHEQGDVENAQIEATIPLIGKKVDVVVWPEGSADLDPLEDASSAEALNNLSSALGAPMIVGAITHRDGKYYNSSLLWEDGKGAVAIYDKAHPVPFGEYVPDRAFWTPFAPSLLDLIGRDYTPGTRANVFDVSGVRAGISICFDIVDDRLTSEMMARGAQVILAQTNNADFGKTKENLQQLAIARERAIETGRSLVNISTVGTSQIIGPDGRTLAEIPAYKPGAMVLDVPLGTTTTPASLLSGAIDGFVALLGLAALVIAGLTLPRTSAEGRKSRKSGPSR
jgi:apolipoprotein N-acyltransferase